VESGEIKTYTTNDGLPSMSIQGILGDEENRALWLSTFAGISRFSIDDEQFNNFALRDGIQGLLYADGQYLKTSSGYFLFGGNNGVTWFNPDDIAENAQPPITYLTRFNVGDYSYAIERGNRQKTPYTLSHTQNNISIDFTGIQYDDPEKNKFAYQLENYDKTWREVGNQRSAYYYNLPPGHYTFKVKAANSHGVWNKEPVSLEFTINPPWWRTWWAYAIYGILIISAIIVFDRIRKRQLLEKERRLAKEKELAQAREIEKAYTELKATQKQLIHSEKMASLGELTAGIAHEIQNPLNFVNNFSEVNLELTNELRMELQNGKMEEVDAIAADIIQNEEKINFHGKRADAIVKSMLQHSRTSTGQKEPTDINALAHEYLRLAYHGLRAKDKSFNADIKLEADPSLPMVNAVGQDMGRVLLNLINNAFYACMERMREYATETKHSLSPQHEYKPEVIVSTKYSYHETGREDIEIRVKDNGSGIPDEVKDKIFQPFFTTKPTGEGTGLGLSMSYDIITKGHGGELTLETEPGKGTQFIIKLPVKNLKTKTKEPEIKN
jgi:signal transduction histidine kinase